MDDNKVTNTINDFIDALKSSNKEIKDFDKLVRNLGKSMPKNANEAFKSAFDNTKNASEFLSKTMKGDLAPALKGLGKGLGLLDNNFVMFSAKFLAVGGGLILGLKELYDIGINLANTYRNVLDVGQNFGNTMIGLSESAAMARMSTEQFSKFIVDNSLVAARIGAQGLGKLSKGVDDNIRSFSRFGLQTEDVNEYLSEYLETQRLTGVLGVMSLDNMRESISNVIMETNAYAQQTGKSRRQIAKDMFEAQKSTYLMLAQTNMSEEELKKFTKSLNDFMTPIAAQDGSQAITQMITEIASGVPLAMNDFTKTLMSSGFGPLANTIQEYAEKIRNSSAAAQDGIDFNNKIISEFAEMRSKNKSAYMALLISGNEQTKQILDSLVKMKAISKEQYEKDKADAARLGGITSFFLNIEQDINRIITAFKEGFMRGLKALDSGSNSFGDFILKLEKPAATLGDLFSKLFIWISKLDFEKLFDNIMKFGSIMYDIANGIYNLLKKFGLIEEKKEITYENKKYTYDNKGNVLSIDDNTNISEEDKKSAKNILNKEINDAANKMLQQIPVALQTSNNYANEYFKKYIDENENKLLSGVLNKNNYSERKKASKSDIILGAAEVSGYNELKGTKSTLVDVLKQTKNIESSEKFYQTSSKDLVEAQKKLEDQINKKNIEYNVSKTENEKALVIQERARLELIMTEVLEAIKEQTNQTKHLRRDVNNQ